MDSLQKKVVETIDQYMDENGDIRPEMMDQFKRDLKITKDIIDNFCSHYNIGQ